MEKKSNLVKILLILFIVITLILSAYIVYDKVLKKDNNAGQNNNSSNGQTVDDNQKQLNNLGDIAGFGSIEKQNETADDSIDIVAFYKDGTIKTIYSFDTDYLKNIVNQGNIMYLTKNVNIDYDNNKLYIQIDKKLYYIDLSKEKYELINLDVNLGQNADKMYVVDNKVYLNFSSQPSKIYDINSKSLTDLSIDVYDTTNFIIDKGSKNIVFTDKYDMNSNVKQTLYYAPLENMDNKVKVYSNDYNGISIDGIYNNNIVYNYQEQDFTNNYSIYNIKDNTNKDIKISGAASIYIFNDALYYTKQTHETDSNNVIKNSVLKLYKYGNSKEVYTFSYGTGGNDMLYIGNGLFEFVDSSNKENNVIIDTDGKTKDLFIIDVNNNKNKLEITKYHNINFEYVEIN